MVEIRETKLAGAKVLIPNVFADNRGFFKETYVQSVYASLGITESFVHDSLSFSSRNVLRGLHGIKGASKIVQVLQGAVFDVIVDARPASPGFGQWEAFELTDRNHLQVYMPAGFLHGFLALTDGVMITYKQDREFDPLRATNVIWNDSDLGIPWPLQGAPVLSASDRTNRPFREIFGND